MVAKKGYTYSFRKLNFWAEAGMVCIEDERFHPDHRKAFQTIAVRDWLHRLNAMSEELKKRPFKYADEREEYIKMLDNGVQVAKDAKAQGRFDDPKAVADMLKERRKHILFSNLPTGMKADGGILLNGAVSADVAPENAVLPPIPKAPPNKPIKKWKD